MQNLIVLFLVVLISSFEAGAQSVSYLAYKHKSVVFFVLAWLIYLVVVYLLWRAYHYRGVGYVNVLWSGITTAFMLMIGYFIFGERLSKEEWVGVVFILIGIGLMTMHHVKNHINKT